MLDNLDLWNIHEAEQERKLARLPKCSYCGEPIQDDICYEIGDELVCEDCLKENFRRWTDDFINE